MSFLTFALSYGVEVDPGKLYASEKINRCGTTDKPRSNNGAWYWNGERGWVMNWSTDGKVIWYNDPNAKPWTPEDKKLWAKKREQSKAEQEKKYADAASKAERMLREAKHMKHEYLDIKGFGELKAPVTEDVLMIPMRNVITNVLQGLQSIYWDRDTRKYEKKMLYGMRSKDAVFWIGNRNATEVWLVEGFATGLSVRDTLRSIGISAAVVVCFSANNMVNVAPKIKGQKFIFADNDKSDTGKNSAIETGLPWTMADTVGEDANDLHKKHGLFSVAKKIMECRCKSENCI